MQIARKAAAHEAHEDLGKVDEALGHAAFGHDGAGKNEERDGEQGKVVGAVGRLQHHRSITA
jgi:hypothetical protein